MERSCQDRKEAKMEKEKDLNLISLTKAKQQSKAKTQKWQEEKRNE